jgi:hypothetical protein
MLISSCNEAAVFRHACHGKEPIKIAAGLHRALGLREDQFGNAAGERHEYL